MSEVHKRFLTTGLAAGPPAAAQARVEFNPAGGAVAPPTLPAPGTAVAVAGRRRRCRQVPLVPDC
jgi:hypothetical protein